MNTSNTNNTGLTVPGNSSRFDRDNLLIMRIGIPLVAIAVVFNALYSVVVDWVLGNPLYFPAGAVSTPGTVNDARNAGIAYDYVTAEFGLTSPSVVARLLSALPHIVFAAAVVVGCWLVYQLMESVAAGRAFDRANVRRLRWLAVAVFVGGGGVPYFDLLAAGSLRDRFLDGGASPMGLDIPFVVPLVWSLVAATITMLGEAFSVGSRLNEDVEGTI